VAIEKPPDHRRRRPFATSAFQAIADFRQGQVRFASHQAEKIIGVRLACTLVDASGAFLVDPGRFHIVAIGPLG
jgi:hypothetical protein